MAHTCKPTNPKPGDIAYFDTQVDGGDSYRVVVGYKYFQTGETGRWGWYNTAGITTEPLNDAHPGLSQLRLLVRDGYWQDSMVHQFALDNQSNQ